MTLKPSTLLLFIFSLFLLMVVYSGYYIINEHEVVIVTRFGKPVSETLDKAGIHFKLPLIDTAQYFDKRILEWDGNPRQVPTRDKKLIHIDTTARWKIVDARKFLESLRDEDGAQSQMDAIISSHIYDEISRNKLIEIVRDSNQLLEKNQNQSTDNKVSGSIEKIEFGREKLTREIISKAKPDLEKYGIELIDVRIKELKYADSVLEKVFGRMISEQEAIASRLLSEGQGKKAVIDGQLNLKLKEIDSGAYQLAQQIKGEGDAESTKIYANAYSKSPELYELLANLEAIGDVVDQNGVLMLSTESEIFRILKSSPAK